MTSRRHRDRGPMDVRQPRWRTAATALAVSVALVAGCSSPSEPTSDLSMEQLDLLAEPRMILLQSDMVDGGADALTTLQSDPLWQRLPAVDAGKVTTLDRLGYPGAVGQIALLADLSDLLG